MAHRPGRCARREGNVRTRGGADLVRRAETGAQFLQEDIAVDPRRLTERAARILADYIDEAGADVNLALTHALEDADLTRRRRMIDWFRANSPPVSGDSTDIIREARDAR